MSKQMHVIARNGRGIRLVDRATHTFESWAWANISDARAAALVDGRFFAHDSKASPSSIGGRIVRLVKAHMPAGDSRWVVTFQADPSGRGVRTGAGGWSQEKKFDGFETEKS